MQIEQKEPVTTEDEQTEATIVSTSIARETPGNRPKPNRGIGNYAEPPEPRMKSGAVRGGRTSQHPISTWRSTKLQQYQLQQDQKWYQQYKKLVGFQRLNGHCQVPARYEPDKTLGVWVGTQRMNHTNNKMQPDRKGLLDEIGFAWRGDRATPRFPNEDKKWNIQYEKLVDFQRKNGHCMVPTRYEQDTSLGWWVGTQRVVHNKHNTMLQDRKERLDALGFIWNAQNRVSCLQEIGLLARKTLFADNDNNNNNNNTSSDVVSLPNEQAPEETKPALDHVRNNRFECPPPANRKRQKTCRVESDQRRGKATGSCIIRSVENNDDRHKEQDPKSPLVTIRGATINSDLDQVVVEEETTTSNDVYLPPGWARIKLEPDW